MKYLYLFFFIILISCVAPRNAYICGERVCVDKKEFKEYFAKNLILEIQTKKSKKTKVDLVMLNTTRSEKNMNKINPLSVSEKITKKEKKTRITNEKKRIKNERRLKQIETKKKIKDDKKLAKLAKLKIKKEKKINPTIKNYPFKKKQKSNKAAKEKQVRKNNTKQKKKIKVKFFESVLSEKQISICNGIKDCDIDKIEELLLKRNEDKNFPDIVLR